MTDWHEQLQRFLVDYGQDVVLKRRVGTTAAYDEVTVRAHVSQFEPDELVAGITQQDTKVILSQAEILAAGWPQTTGGSAWPRNGDFMVINGAQRAVTAGAPHVTGALIVRLNATVRG